MGGNSPGGPGGNLGFRAYGQTLKPNPVVLTP